MLKYRMATAEDFAFVHNSWLESSWYQYKKVPNAKNLMSQRIKDILTASSAIVCSDEQEPESIYGYIVFDSTAVHWTYVKYVFRKKGIATKLVDLLPDTIVEYTHTSNAAECILKHKDWKYNPFVYERVRLNNENGN